MFDQFYHQSSDQLKLSFLEEAFRKYPNLKEDFLAFYLKPSDSQLKMTINDPDEFILANKDSIIEQLQSIDLNEPDWEDYVPRHGGYIPEYEAREHLAEDQLAGILAWHVGEVEKYCSEKQFDLAFLLMISLYQACSEAELDDEYETLPDANDTLIHLLEDQLQICMPLFQAIQLSENQLFTIVSVLFDQFQKNYSHDPGFLTFFDSFLNAVIHSGSEANIVLDLIEKKKVGHHVPWLLTELHRKSGGEAAWEQSAREVFKKNIHVASALLEFYKTDHKPEFVRIARALWNEDLFREELAGLYFENMDADDDQDLYKSIVVHLNDRGFSEKYYRKIQSLMGVEERMIYIEKFKRNRPAYVHALSLEGKHDEMLKFAAQHTDRWNFHKMMTFCIKTQAKPGLELLEKTVEKLLKEERGRDFYESIASVMKDSANNPIIQGDVKRLATRLFSEHSRLSALRDELRKARLVDP